MNHELTPNQLIYKKEKIYYSIALISSILSYAALFLSVVGIFIMAIIIVLPLLLHVLTIAHIRTNGVRLSSQQFPVVFEKVKSLCGLMDIPKVPDVYVMESGGILNAFATRFFGRNMVVLYSDIFELINIGGEEELSFVIAHELAHIKRNHITKQLFILPALWVPFMGEAYSRACEYTCDRMAAYYIRNPEAAMNGLTILAVGKSLYRQVNRSDYLHQNSQEKGLFVWLIEKLSTHPPLPKRIDEVQVFSGTETARIFKSTKAGVWIIITVSFLVIVPTVIGGFYTEKLIDASINMMDGLSSTKGNPLAQPTSEGDLGEVKSLLESGVDPNFQDSNGWTALMWAAQDNNMDIVQALIDAGADPNVSDEYEETALRKAMNYNHLEMIQALVRTGADIDQQDSYGFTPLMIAVINGDIEAVQKLLELGADTSLEDAEMMNAYMYAKKGGYPEIAELLITKKEERKE